MAGADDSDEKDRKWRKARRKWEVGERGGKEIAIDKVEKDGEVGA